MTCLALRDMTCGVMMLWILQIDFLCELVTLSLALNETNSEFWNFFNELQNEKNMFRVLLGFEFLVDM